MSEQFSMQIAGSGHWVPGKLKIVQSSTHVPVGDNDVYIFIQSNVDLFRVVEIMEGLKFCANWMRDSNQLSSVAGAIYTYVQIGRRHADVNQAVDISGVTVNDIGIGVGANVNADPIGTDSFNQILDSAFRMLREYAKDEFLKKL